MTHRQQAEAAIAAYHRWALATDHKLKAEHDRIMAARALMPADELAKHDAAFKGCFIEVTRSVDDFR